jgi:hypothetical protein
MVACCNYIFVQYNNVIMELYNCGSEVYMFGTPNDRFTACLVQGLNAQNVLKIKVHFSRAIHTHVKGFVPPVTGQRF